MGVSDVVARGVAMVGAAAILARRWGKSPHAPAMGTSPQHSGGEAAGDPDAEDADGEGLGRRGRHRWRHRG